MGGFNAFTVTGSRGLGVAAGLLDGLKGLIPALAAASTGEFRLAAMALLAAVAGHIFPVWLRFRGGRGLATACGGLFVLSPHYIVVWCSLWLVGRRIRRSILAANVAATVLTPLLLAVVPADLLQYLVVWAGEPASLRLFALFLSALLILGHWNVLREVAAELSRSPNRDRSSA